MDSENVDAAVRDLESVPADERSSAELSDDSAADDLDDDDLFSGFKGRPARRRRGESRTPDADAQSSRDSHSERSQSRSPRERGDTQPRGEAADFGEPSVRDSSPVDRDSRRTRNDRDATEDRDPRVSRHAEGEEGDEGTGSRSSRSRRGRRRGQRQRLADPKIDHVDEDDLPKDSIAEKELDVDDAGVQHSLERIEQADSDEDVPRRRRRRRRGRGSRGETAQDASRPAKDDDRPSRSRNEDETVQKAGPAIEAVFDDDHEDAEETTELRRGRRRRPRRGRSSEKTGERGDRSSGATDREPAEDDSVAAPRRHRDVTTWQDTVDILISSNMSSRKNDSRGRGRQRSNGSSRRRD